MEIIVPIGISGSGKTTLYKSKYSDYKIVSPDLIRKELTGNISDQSKNALVFEEVDRMVKKLISENKSFFYDATNVNTKFRVDFVKKAKANPNVKVVYIYMPDNVSESYNRIKNDLTNGVDRSNVTFDILCRQHKLYKESLKSDWNEEGADSAIFMCSSENDTNRLSKQNGDFIFFNEAWN